MKRLILSAMSILCCHPAVRAAHGAAPSMLPDCRHLLVQDVALSDRIADRRHRGGGAPGATGRKGVEIRFDPIPGIGILHGATFTPTGRLESNAQAGETLNALQGQLTALRITERRMNCPASPAK